MITADPEQLEHWRRTGIIDAGQPVIIITTEAQVAEIWSERGYIDHNTTVMVIDANTDPESWAREFPAEAQLVYTTHPQKRRSATGARQEHLRRDSPPPESQGPDLHQLAA